MIRWTGDGPLPNYSSHLGQTGTWTSLAPSPCKTFDCTGRSYGYYADVATDCRIFHVCLPITDEEGAVAETAHFSFVCGNQTVFSQESLTCVLADEAVACAEAESLFEVSNAQFGIVDDVEV
ncbi:hypothetical protein O3P69_005520 [Scylla paramamosain]|uniref:Chitin-binding type-2 domain-containing protein n=1 Tax=Scylla paramamosain TaxID=85552 RepID=A0AAW0U902_SCYPA